MAVLDPNEIFFTPFEPKQANRFIMYMDGVPSYMVKGVGAVSLTQGEVTLNHMNVQRKVKGKSVWNDVSFTLFDPGRDGYSDFYKKELKFNVLGPVGDVVSEWILKGAFIKEAGFGEYNWDTVDTAIELTMTVGIDYAILNF